jgi:anaerobic magnesium-protoporphyrin IX monomethyl ester cyclase
MKVILIQFRFNKPGKPYNRDSTEKNLRYMFPLGLPSLSAILKREGHDVTCLNLNHYEGTTQYLVHKEMFLAGFDVAFVGGLSLYYPHIRDLIESVRIASPKTKVVCGGGIITAQPNVMMRLLKPDYGISGEGELSATKLVKYLEDGFVPVDLNKIVTSDPIMDLDSLPIPDYESFNFQEYVDNVKQTDYFAFDVVDNPRVYPLVASRSCIFNCTFCFHPLGKKYRQRSIDSIMNELYINVQRYNINIVTIYDELFSNDPWRTKDFCRRFKKLSDTLDHKLWFVCNIRVNTVNDETLQIMKDSGACTVSYGLESYSQDVLSSMKKHITPDQIYNAAVLTRKHHLGFQGNFIFGDPAETLETAKETLDFVHRKRNLLGTAVALDFVVPFQGSELYQKCLLKGTIPSEMDLITEREATGYPKSPINMTTLSPVDFEKLQDMVFLEKMDDPYVIDSYLGVLICPSCGDYIGFQPDIPAFRPLNVGCRSCHYRFNVVRSWYPFIKVVLKGIGRKNTRKLESLKARFT